MEKWRDIPGYEGDYMVSNLGRIKSMVGRRRPKEKVLRDFNIGSGYRYVTLSVGGRRTNMLVHRAVALAFIGEPKIGDEVNHKNGDKTDNRAANLEWVSHKQNIAHARNVLGAESSKKRVICVGDEGVYCSISEAARWAGVREGKMRQAIRTGEKIKGARWIILDGVQ